jgi:hypothetical protein
MRDPIEPDAPFRALLEPGERLLWHSPPGTRGLFLSVLPRLLRDLFFLAVAIAALLLGWSQTNDSARIVVILLALFLVWSLFGEAREATAARISHYLVTDRRLLVILPRGAEGIRSYPHGRLGTALDSRGRTIASINGPATHGKLRGGRATVTVPVRGYVTLSRNAARKGYRSWTVKLRDVAEPGKAVTALRPPR